MSSTPRLLSLLTLVLCTCATAGLKTGDPLPDLSSAGATPTTAGRVVLLDFWASWCAPCKASFPAFARLHNEFKERGLVIIAVGIDEKDAAHQAFVRKMQPPFVTLHDRTHAIVAAAGAPAMPTSYLFGRDGRLRSIHEGFHGKQTESELRAEIETLLAEDK
jgi:thiol-disulfide isomerase/thioredoxin